MSPDWKLIADQHADTVLRVRAALLELQSGEHATNGRDFGRGVAHAASVIAAALADTQQEVWADPINVAKYGTAET